VKKLLIVLTLIISGFCNSQNLSVALNATSSPISGCQLSSTQIVRVNIFNNGAPAGGGTYTVSYTVNGGPVTSQVAGTPLGPTGSYNFAFATTANLSACGSYQMKVWVKHPLDVDAANDTVTWLVQNDCFVIPGTLQLPDTVCSTGNAGSLTIVGWSNGSILNWQSSVNGGATWTTISNSTPSQTYLNLTQTTLYRVNYSGGFCPNATSPNTTIMVENPPVVGVLSGPDTLCESSASGTLTVTGSAAIEEWEFSTNSGASWTGIANTTNSLNFPTLTSSTLFRVKYLSYSCGASYSNQHLVFIEPSVTSASVFGSDTVCASGAAGTLSAVGVTTGINFWETSTNNGVTWTTVASTSPFINYFNPTQTTIYRFNVNGIYCPDSYSSTGTITVQPIPTSPTLNGSTSLCEDSDNGLLTLALSGDSILNWESSINSGVTWTPIINTNDTLNFTNLGQTTQFRVFFDGGVCSDYYSTVAIVTIDSLLISTDILSSNAYCIDSIGTPITINANLNSIDEWELSTNGGITWIGSGISSQTFDISSLTQTTLFQVLLDGKSCPDIFTDTAEIEIDNFNSGTINGGGTYCAQSLNELVSVVGLQGNIGSWQTSTDGGTTWTAVAGINDTLIFPTINQTTDVRVITQGTICPADTSSSVTITIDQQTDPGQLLSDRTICQNDSVHLTLINYTSSSFNWESSIDNSIWNSIPTTYDSLNIIQSITQSFWARVIVKNGICGFDTSNFVYIDVKPLPLVNVSSDVTIDEGDTITITAVSLFSGIWSPFATVSNPNLPITECFPLVTTDYFYTVTDNFGCQASDTLRVTVIPSEEFEIMNLITANNDQFNDEWIIKGLANFPGTEVIVFNVYGDKVYENKDYSNDWEGTFKDRSLPNGTYYYVVKQGVVGAIYKGTLSILGNE
jgi:gliding motility-associated-like protein